MVIFPSFAPFMPGVRFYINCIEWLMEKGLINFSANSMDKMVHLYRTLPVEPFTITTLELVNPEFYVPRFILN